MSAGPSTISIPRYEAGTWKADLSNSEITFCISTLMFHKVRGKFGSYDIVIVTGADPVDSSVSATIQLASLDTGNSRRDKHLRSADIIDTDNHPTVSYTSTAVRYNDNGWVIDGNLTLCGTTNPVPLALTVHGFDQDPDGGRRARFSATARVGRRAFGIPMPMDSVGFAADTVLIGLEIEATREP